MKYLIIAMAILLSSCSSALKLCTDEDKEFYRTYDVAGTQDDIYLKTLEYMHLTFYDANEVIHFQDMEGGKIIAKYITYDLKYKSTMVVDAKDGAVRIQFFNPALLTGGLPGPIVYKMHSVHLQRRWDILTDKLIEHINRVDDW